MRPSGGRGLGVGSGGAGCALLIESLKYFDFEPEGILCAGRDVGAIESLPFFGFFWLSDLVPSTASALRFFRGTVAATEGFGKFCSELPAT
jgi:hypothetical protein